MTTKEKIAIVTGANSGIGYAVTKGLLLGEAKVVVMACRNLKRAELAKARLIAETKRNQLDIILCDLSSLKSIQEFARIFTHKYRELDILCHCAGHINFKRELTVEGFESNFMTNVLGPYALTKFLVPALTKPTMSSVINIAGEFHRFFAVDFDNLFYQKKFSPMRVGSVSMLQRIMLTYSLAEQLKSTNILVNCFHPGNVRTELNDKLPWTARLLSNLLRPNKLTPDEGADTALWLTTQNSTGQYFIKRKSVPSSKVSYDVTAQKKLKDVCDKCLVNFENLPNK